jgi:hypothetical protein
MRFLAILGFSAFAMALPTAQHNKENNLTKRHRGYGERYHFDRNNIEKLIRVQQEEIFESSQTTESTQPR